MSTAGPAITTDASAVSVLAGSLSGNPFLESGPARLIVNEVTGGGVSNLFGRIEVFGSAADVVVANPWGITCNGCGFINTHRASLVTGRPMWAGAALDGFSVTGGALIVGSSGLAGTSLGSLDLIGGSIAVASAVQLEAGNSAIYAIAGPNQVNYSSLAATPLARSSAPPALAIDVAATGGMYANQIYLMATERGIGVNQLGSLHARTGALTLDSAGDLRLGGSMRSSGGSVVISASNINTDALTVAADGLALLQSAGVLALNNTSVGGADVMLVAGSTLNAVNTQLKATADARIAGAGEVNLLAGRIDAGGSVALSAAGDLTLSLVASSAITVDGATTRTTTRFDRVMIAAGNNITAQSTTGIVTLDGAQLSASAGSIAIQGMGVALNARKDLTKEVTTAGNTTTKPTAETLVGVNLRAEGDIAVLASGTGLNQGNLFAAGALIESSNGHVSLFAARDADLTNDITTDRFYERFYEVKRGWFSKRVTENIKTSVDETVQSGMVSGRSVSIGAGGQLNLVGSAVQADGAVGLHADGDLNLLSAAENDYAYSSRSVSKSGIFGNGGLSITIGSKNSTTVSSSERRLQYGSSVGSLSGDILATAGGQYLQLSSDLTAPLGDVSIAAANVVIKSADNTSSALNLMRQRQSGITLSANHPLIETAQTVDQMLKLARRTDNGRYQALGLLTAGLTVYNNYKAFGDSLKAASDPLTGSGWGGWNVSATVGSSSSSFESITKTSTPVSSAVDAGRNISIVATGTGANSGDINLIAAKLSAGGDMQLSAQRDITLAAAVGLSSETTKTRSSSGAVGLGYGSNGLSFTVAASRSNGYSNGWGTTYWQSQLAAGEKLSLDTGRNLALNGAKASGKSVLARVGSKGEGNLVISSPQDEDHYIAKEQSWGINASIPVPGTGSTAPPSLGLNASGLRLMAEYESVRQQSAISAGTGGFDINVNGHTHLRGGAITTEGAAAASRLVTQTLTHETLQNKDVAEGRSWSVGLSIADKAADAKQAGNGPLAGSSAGYARIDTNHVSHTLSGVGGTVSLTRADLQASRLIALRAGERAPLESRRAAAEARLRALELNEPPRCDLCQTLGAPGSPLASNAPNAQQGSDAQPASTSPALNAESGSMGGSDALGGSSRWLAWKAACARLQAEIVKLSGRIDVINAKAYGDAASLVLNSPSLMHQPLLQTFDRDKATQQLKDGVAVTAAFGKAAYKTAGDVAKQRYAEALAGCAGNVNNCPEADKWKDGGIYKAALHAVVGGLAFGQAGALAGLTAELAEPKLKALITAAGFAEGTLAYNVLMIGAKSMIGAGVGAVPGAATAFNADANNRQLHPAEIDIIKREARNFAKQQKGGVEPSPVEVDAAEKRLAQEAFRLVQFGVAGNADSAAQAYLRGFKVQLPGDPLIAGQTAGYSFYADPLQKANPNMYANLVVNSFDALDFYRKNEVTQPTFAQAEAAIARYQRGQDKAASLTMLAGLFAGGLTLAPMAPVAITACLSNITLCGIQAAELAAGSALGPTGMGMGNLAARAGVKSVLTPAQANAEWRALMPGNTDAWPEGLAVLNGQLNTGTTMRMYVNAKTADQVNNGDLSGLGGWATFDDPARSIAQMRQNMALSETFRGKAPSDGPFYVVELQITKPMEVNVGFVGPQTDIPTSFAGTKHYRGGGTQIQIIDFNSRTDYVKIVAPPKKVGGP